MLKPAVFNIFKQTFSHSFFFLSDPLNFSLYVKITNKESHAQTEDEKSEGEIFQRLMSRETA